MGLIPARKAVAFLAQKGQEVTITNTHGKQVVDFWAFNPHDPNDYLSMVHTRTVLVKVALARGGLALQYAAQADAHLGRGHDARRARSALVGVRRREVSDAGVPGALKQSFPDFHIADHWVPDPLNLFMNVAIDHRGGLDIRPPTSEKGEYVTLRAHTDLVIVTSACPQDMAPVNAGMPTDCEYRLSSTPTADLSSAIGAVVTTPRRKVKAKVALSVDFDAVSHWLGTGCHKDNNMADYSSGIFAGRVGAYRLLDLFRKYDIADKVTWFIPGHTVETFPEAAQAVLESGAEIGLHGYAHEGIYQMTEEQEQEVLLKCIEVATKLTGKKPLGYRAPMYTIRETTVALLRAHGFLYDSSLMHHDSQPYFTPADPPITPIDFTQPASSWLHPSSIAPPQSSRDEHPLVELPCGWYNEDMMPLQYLPHLANSMGYVSTRVVEEMWKDKFLWLWENTPTTTSSSSGSGSETASNGKEEGGFVFLILIHPDTSGMAHIIGMVERVVQWLKGLGAEVEFCTHEEIARGWLDEQRMVSC